MSGRKNPRIPQWRSGEDRFYFLLLTAVNSSASALSAARCVAVNLAKISFVIFILTSPLDNDSIKWKLVSSISLLGKMVKF